MLRSCRLATVWSGITLLSACNVPVERFTRCPSTRLLGSVCPTHELVTSIVVAGNMTIDTTRTTPGNCSEILEQETGPSLCLIGGTTISVGAGATLRATGSNPLVLIATESITIAAGGGIDISSHDRDASSRQRRCGRTHGLCRR